MGSRWRLVVVILLYLFNAFPLGASTNVIIFLADNLGYEDVGYFSKGASSKGSNTPNLDSLARQSLVFEHWNSAAHLCSASRAALLTGQYPVKLGVYPGVFANNAAHGLRADDERAPTLARLLKDRGYATAIVGKWHLGQREMYLPYNHGFDDCRMPCPR